MIGQGHTRHIRTWYGVWAEITVGPGFIHKAGVGPFLIPHPPAVNWLLRQGLAENNRLDLNIRHEFSHFQSAPAIFIYAMVLLVKTVGAGHTDPLALLLALVSIQAAWEMMCEALTIINNPIHYRKAYEGTQKFTRILFWSVSFTLTMIGWLLAFY